MYHSFSLLNAWECGGGKGPRKTRSTHIESRIRMRKAGSVIVQFPVSNLKLLNCQKLFINWQVRETRFARDTADILIKAEHRTALMYRCSSRATISHDSFPRSTEILEIGSCNGAFSRPGVCVPALTRASSTSERTNERERRLLTAIIVRALCSIRKWRTALRARFPRGIPEERIMPPRSRSSILRVFEPCRHVL